MSDVQLNVRRIFTQEELAFLAGKAGVILQEAVAKNCQASFMPDPHKLRGNKRVWEKEVLTEEEEEVLSSLGLSRESVQLIMRFFGMDTKSPVKDELESSAFGGINLTQTHAHGGATLFDEPLPQRELYSLEFDYVKTEPHSKLGLMGSRLTQVKNCVSLRLSARQMTQLMRLDGKLVSCTLTRVGGVVMSDPINAHLPPLSELYQNTAQRTERLGDYSREMGRLKELLEEGGRSASDLHKLYDQADAVKLAWEEAKHHMVAGTHEDVRSILDHACKTVFREVREATVMRDDGDSDDVTKVITQYLRDAEKIDFMDGDR